MFLDGKDIGLSKVIITNSKAIINGVEIPTKCINIYSKDSTYRFTFWTIQEYEKFNELELNKKTSIIDFIDSYDIDFSSLEHNTINTKDNTEIYFTKKGKNKYLLNVEINDLDNIGDNLKIETIIKF